MVLPSIYWLSVLDYFKEVNVEHLKRDGTAVSWLDGLVVWCSPQMQETGVCFPLEHRVFSDPPLHLVASMIFETHEENITAVSCLDGRPVWCSSGMWETGVQFPVTTDLFTSTVATLREHQEIRTNATISKVSNLSFTMSVC